MHRLSFSLPFEQSNGAFSASCTSGICKLEVLDGFDGLINGISSEAFFLLCKVSGVKPPSSV